MVSSISMIDDKSWLEQPASCSLTVGSMLWLAPSSRRIARIRSSKGDEVPSRLPAAGSLENSRQECYQPRVELPRNWPHISSFVWVESKGAVAHRLETLSVKSSLALSVKRKLVQKETMADCHRQSYDKDPGLGICGIIVQEYTWTSIKKTRKENRKGRRLFPWVCHLLLNTLSPHVQNNIKNVFKRNLYTQWGALVSWWHMKHCSVSQQLIR